MIQYIAALLPVLLFIGALLWLDSFSLIKKSNLLIAFAWGSFLILFVGNVNYYMSKIIPFQLIVAPITEEFLKTIVVLFLIKTKRSAFFIDALIYGVAAGAGFAFFENISYLSNIPDMTLGTALMRGLGTAIMHCGAVGGSAAILSWLAYRTGHCVRYYIISLIPAMILHSLYNAMLLPPFLSLLIILFGVFAWMLFLIFYNEKSIGKWLDLEIFSEVELLEAMQKGTFTNSRAGKYLLSIRDNFEKEKFWDMYCYVRIYLELSLRSKRNMMLKEAGLEVPEDGDIKEKIQEFMALKKHIGKTGELALSPIIKQDNLFQWKINSMK